MTLDKNSTLSIDLSSLMANQGLTIAQAARTTGMSTRTIRRYIKSGRISAELIPSNHGQEFRIANIPDELTRQRTLDKQPSQSIDIIRELQDKNLQLAAQLGAASERIRTLENQVKLLTTGKQPWWRRLFKIRR